MDRTFYDLLSRYRMVSPFDLFALEVCLGELSEPDGKKREDIGILLCILFSLTGDGNVGMSADQDVLLEKWKKKTEASRIMNEEKEDFNGKDIETVLSLSEKAIEDSLTNLLRSNLVGEDRFFVLDGNFLYIRKYEIARRGILSRLDLLKKEYEAVPVREEEIFKGGFRLNEKQELASKEGLRKNLLITGGPGTGKTTSIIKLLINLLLSDPSYQVYLVAPSGKAASRMKESLIGNYDQWVSEKFRSEHPDLSEYIENLGSMTIHSLLGVSPEDGLFVHGKENLLPAHSIYVVDEASMIDLCLFSSLLNALPDDARLFIMGDKNQLPSVEAGAVFGELLKRPDLKDHIVELDESIRFKKGTQVYELAGAVNEGKELPVKEEDWKDIASFVLHDDTEEEYKKKYPVFYYRLSGENASQGLLEVSEIWAERFYKTVQKDCSSLAGTYRDGEEKKAVVEAFEKIDAVQSRAKILCAENKGKRGVETLNRLIRKAVIDPSKKTPVDGYYPGMLMMVNTNNRVLDLYNGDSGILVSFQDDPALYFMIRKETKAIKDEGKRDGEIFKIGPFVFYPFTKIPLSQIDPAFAITIHKSQGSDYKNILVVLPDKKGHPLLNRQILYTAITRTKGTTYILSDQERLEEAAKNVLIRDTNLSE
jgi:exodeoxyribonuclease V alpha subunit